MSERPDQAAAPFTLRQLEEALLAQVTGVAGTEPAAGFPRAEDLVVGDERLGARGRVAIYADMYFSRLLEALREDFPKVAAQLGDDGFRDLAARFVAALPPPPALRHLGQGLPGFLETRETMALPGWQAWLPDLARLEWSRADIFDRLDWRPLDLETVRARATRPGGLDDLLLTAVPALELCPVSFAVEERWRALERGAVPSEGVPVPAAPGQLLVWRRGAEILHRRATADEAACLPLLIQGITFGTLAERLGEGRTVEEAARLSFELVAGWIAAGLVRGERAGEGPE